MAFYDVMLQLLRKTACFMDVVKILSLKIVGLIHTYLYNDRIADISFRQLTKQNQCKRDSVQCCRILGLRMFMQIFNKDFFFFFTNWNHQQSASSSGFI